MDLGSRLRCALRGQNAVHFGALYYLHRSRNCYLFIVVCVICIVNMAATVVNVGRHTTLYFSSKMRSVVYYCEACVKVQNVQCHLYHMYKIHVSIRRVASTH